jgi:hypothetical protein
MSRFNLKDLYTRKLIERQETIVPSIQDILPTEQVSENAVLTFDGQNWVPQVMDPVSNVLQNLALSGTGRSGDTVVYNSQTADWELGFNAPVKFYDSPGDLPTVGVRNGTIAFVTNSSEQTKRLYVWKGTTPGVTHSGTWYEIMTTNNSAAITSRMVGGELVQSFDGLIFEVTPNIPLVVTLTSEDPEGLPLTWDFTVSNPEAFSVTNQQNGSFIINAIDNSPLTANITFKLLEVAEQGQNIISEFATFVINVSTDIRNSPVLTSTFVYDPQINFSLSNQGIRRLYKKNNLFFVLNSLAQTVDSSALLTEDGNSIGYPTIPRLVVFSTDGNTITEVGRYPKTPDPSSPNFEQEKQDAITVANTIFRTNSGSTVFVPDMVVLDTHILFRVRDTSQSAASKLMSLDYTIDQGNITFGVLKNAYSPSSSRPQWPPSSQRSMIVSEDGNFLYLVSGQGPSTTTGTNSAGMILDISSPENISRPNTFQANGVALDIYEPANTDTVYIVRTASSRFYMSRYNKLANTIVNFATDLPLGYAATGVKVYTDRISSKVYAIFYGPQTSVILLDDPLDPDFKDSELNTRSIISSMPNAAGVSSVNDVTIDEEAQYMFMVGSNFFGSVYLADIENLSSSSITGQIVNYDDAISPDIAVGVELYDENTTIVALDGALDRIGIVK